jgi:hypothetical protein
MGLADYHQKVADGSAADCKRNASAHRDPKTALHSLDLKYQ